MCEGAPVARTRKGWGAGGRAISSKGLVEHDRLPEGNGGRGQGGDGLGFTGLPRS